MSDPILRFHFRTLLAGTVGLPFMASIICVLTTIIRYPNANYTHCEVTNFAPSISAAIGTFKPQRYIWQGCIALHCAPRFLFAFLHAHHFHQRLPHTTLNAILVKLVLIVHVVEILGLLALTIVSSHENFPIHKTAFGTFIFCSLIYMCVSVYLCCRAGYSAQNHYERYAVILKKRFLRITLFSVILMLYFYWRHNEYCEPYVYSFFCICEYVIVLSNMAFHGTAYYDFYASDCLVTRSTLDYRPLSSVDSSI